MANPESSEGGGVEELVVVHVHQCPVCGALWDCDDPWCQESYESPCSECTALLGVREVIYQDYLNSFEEKP